MNLTPTQIALLIGALVVVAIVVYMLVQRQRSRMLRQHFGPEYERAVAEGGDRRRAEAKLAERAERVKSYHLRPLAAAERNSFVEAWNGVQAQFVDSPSAAVTHADRLLGDVMAARGYPVSDFEQRAADVSVEHPAVVQNYRTAHDIALRHARGEASTEELRKALIHYRALFDELTAENAAVATGPAAVPRARDAA